MNAMIKEVMAHLQLAGFNPEIEVREGAIGIGINGKYAAASFKGELTAEINDLLAAKCAELSAL